MTDPLTPEDRALYDAFFKAYGEKLAELSAEAAPGSDVSLDVCTVHAIKTCVDRKIERRYLEIIPPLEPPRIIIIPSIEPAPRIVSAVGVGVRVKRPEESASLYDQIVEAVKTAPAGRTSEAVNEVIRVAKLETPKLSAEGREIMRAARQAYGVCEWWDEIDARVGQLRRFKSSTCGAPDWRNNDHGYRKMTLDKWIEEFGRCQCGRVIVMRGEDELAEGGE